MRRCRAFLAGLLLVTACSDPAPEEVRIREMVDQARAAVEQRSIRRLGRLLSESFLDDRGRTREEILGQVAYFLRGHESIFILTRVTELRLTGADQAELVVVAALSGRPVATPEELAQGGSELLRFDLALTLEGDGWRVNRAAWRRTSLREML